MYVKIIGLTFLSVFLLYQGDSLSAPTNAPSGQSSEESSPSSGTIRIVVSPKPDSNNGAEDNGLPPSFKIKLNSLSFKKPPPADGVTEGLASPRGKPSAVSSTKPDSANDSDEAESENNVLSAAAAAATSGGQPSGENPSENPWASQYARADSERDLNERQPENGEASAAAAAGAPVAEAAPFAAVNPEEKPVDNAQFHYTKKDLPVLKAKQKGLKKIADAYRNQIDEAKKNREEDIAYNFAELLRKNNQNIATLQQTIDGLGRLLRHILNSEGWWWREQDSNLRRRTSADLQSAAFDRSAIPPAFTAPQLRLASPLCEGCPSNPARD